MMAATADYWRWVQAGRPFRRPPWLQQLKDLAKVHEVAFLGDLGSDDERHLKASRPQDHCPFSYTEWPVQIAEYVINAIDLGNGPWAYRLIDYGKRGMAPWLKYVNIDRKHYSRKNNWIPVSNSDVHGHVSGMSNHTWTGLNGLNPFVEGDQMNQNEIDRLQWMAHSLEFMTPTVEGGPVKGRVFELAVTMDRIESKLDKLLTAGGLVVERRNVVRPLGLLAAAADEPDAEGDGGQPADPVDTTSAFDAGPVSER